MACSYFTSRCTSRVLHALLTLVWACASSAALVACGGGGGGSAAPLTAPGTLRALAIEGAAAPGTTGMFAAVPTYPLMDAADGGYAAFVLPTTDAARAEVLYVAEPDAVPTIVPVFAIGDPALSPGGGTISGFAGVWICADGAVLVLVTITGDAGGRLWGVLSAQVTGGTASNKTAAIFDLTDLTAIGGAGLLTAIDADTLCKSNTGAIWFLGEDGAGPLHLMSVAKDGTGLTMRARVGSALGINRGGGAVVSIDAFTIDTTGSVFAYVATASQGASRRIVAKGPGLDVEFFGTGDFFPTVAGGTVTNVFKGGRMLAFATGQVLWVAQGNLGATDDVLMLYEPLNTLAPYTVLARSGDIAPGTGPGALGTISTLSVAHGSVLPGIHASVIGGANGISQANYAVIGTGASNLDPDSSNVRSFGGALVPSAWVDLTNTNRPYDEVSQNGSILFTQAFAGTSHILWSIRGVGSFKIAEQGGMTPGGDTFGSFVATSATCVANENALLRADLVTAGSGLYRRGP